MHTEGFESLRALSPMQPKREEDIGQLGNRMRLESTPFAFELAIVEWRCSGTLVEHRGVVDDSWIFRFHELGEQLRPRQEAAEMVHRRRCCKAPLGHAADVQFDVGTVDQRVELFGPFEQVGRGPSSDATRQLTQQPRRRPVPRPVPPPRRSARGRPGRVRPGTGVVPPLLTGRQPTPSHSRSSCRRYRQLGRIEKSSHESFKGTSHATSRGLRLVSGKTRIRHAHGSGVGNIEG